MYVSKQVPLKSLNKFRCNICLVIAQRIPRSSLAKLIAKQQTPNFLSESMIQQKDLRILT
jgi:hypothetical protein